MKGFLISPLTKSHNRKAFSCGVNSLDTYFHKQSGQDGRKRVAVTYVLNDQNDNKVIAYYTLSAASIELASIPDAIQKKLPSYPCLPATLIGKLAVDEAYKKRGFGGILLVDAMKRAYRISSQVASFAVIVDPIDNNAAKFYKKYGFLDLSVSNKKLFMPMTAIAKL